MSFLKYSGPVSLLVFLPILLTAQTAQDPAPLKNWATPLYWQPNQIERENTARSGAQIQFSPNATSNTALVFVAVSPCRLVDTRGASAGFTGSTPFSGPYIPAGGTATFPVQSSTETATTAPSPCGAIPSIAQAYSLNLTVFPHPLGTSVNYVTMWPTGATIPQVSTLNDQQGALVSNAAIVPAGSPSGGINVFAYGATDVIIDMNGFYAAPTDLNSNTAIGAGTLLSNTTGGQNTAVGQSALSANTTGNYNTAVGLDALQQNTIGAANTASGNSALSNNITGSGNTASGQAALLYNTAGSNNTAHGTQALIDNSTGNNNTAVGAGAAFTATAANANVSGSNNTYIGYQCGSNTSTQLNNSFCLGSGALFGTSNTGVFGNASVSDVYFGGLTAQAVAHALAVSLTGTSTGVTKLVAANTAGTNFTITVPNPSGATDTFCLQTLANCGSGGGSTPTGPAGGTLSGTYPNPGFAAIAAGTFLGNFTGGAAAPVATSLATAKLCTWIASPLASAIHIDNGAGCPQDSTATYTSSGLNIPAGAAYLYGGVSIAQAQTSLNNFYFGGAGNLTGSGPFNTASGFGALSGNTSGNRNTANGSHALNANTIGVSNTAIGESALFSNTTGGNNTALGAGALGGNTIGTNNTASGTYALAVNTTGSQNTAVGESALYANTANGLTAVGSLALQDNTTGTNNTAIGAGAGLTSTIANTNVSGSNNTYMGYQCGANTSTQLNNSFCLGAGALFGASNMGVLGNSSVTDIFLGGPSAQAVAHALGVSLTGTSIGVTKLVSSNTGGANYTITVPNPSGAVDTFCLMTLANCGSGGGGGTAGGVLSGAYPNPGFAPIAAGTLLGNFTGGAAAPVATSLATAKLCTWIASPLASAIHIDNGAGCAQDSTATYTASGLNIPAGSAYLYGGAQIAIGQPANSNFYFGNAGNLTGTGGANTATGSQALQNNITGEFNTATGTRALQNNLTGFGNTASGAEALYANTTGGENTANGYNALSSNTSGGFNTANGYYALSANTTGYNNTASGYLSLSANTIGGNNTATGDSALYANITGGSNTAAGYSALTGNITGGGNTATGVNALGTNTTGNSNTANGYNALYNSNGTGNTAIGYGAGSGATTGSNNIHIANSGSSGDNNVIRIGTLGTQTSAFIAGISGTAVSGVNVVVSSNGQLGVATSSRRFKEQITDMGDTSDKLLQLRPVNFFYKPEYDDGSHLLQYGLIAEEVEKVYPEMVAYDSDGKIMTVKYQMLAPMLLNEVQKQNARLESEVQARAEENHKIEEQNRQQVDQIHSLEERLAALEALMSSGAAVAKSGGSQ